jgi:hypothetical protein
MSIQVIKNGRPHTVILNGKSMGMSLSIKRVTTDYTINATDDIIEVDATAGNVYITIGPRSGFPNKVIMVKKIDTSAYTVRVDTVTETIDETNWSFFLLAKQFDSIILVAGTTRWMIFSERRAGKTANKIILPTPTISGWNTNPAPLAECLDHDYHNFTTAGLITVASATGSFTFDLGEICMVAVSVYSVVANCGLFSIDFSLDNATFYAAGLDDGWSTNPDHVIMPAQGIGRYIRIRYKDAGVGTMSLTQCSISAIGAPTDTTFIPE